MFGKKVIPKNKVYISHENTKLDYALASTYGEVEIVAVNEYSAMLVSKANTQTISDINKTVKKFNPDHDYVVISGDSLIFGILLTRLLMEHGSAQILKWSPRDAKYNVVHINLENITLAQ